MLFRADSLSQLQVMLTRLFTVWELESLWRLIRLVNGRECLLMALLVLGVLALEWAGRKRDLTAAVFRLPLAARWAVYFALLFVLILFGKYNESPSFIYFQF